MSMSSKGALSSCDRTEVTRAVKAFQASESTFGMAWATARIAALKWVNVVLQHQRMELTTVVFSFFHHAAAASPRELPKDSSSSRTAPSK